MGTRRAETLVWAKHLVNGKDINRLNDGFVEYYQLLFDEHQIIYTEGIAAESLLFDQRAESVLPDEAKRGVSLHKSSYQDVLEVDEETAFNQCGEPAPSSLARVKFVFPRILNAQELPSANARNIGKS